MGKYPLATHVIFDMDGLLLDTERLYSEANSQVLKKYGKEFSWDVKKRQMGRKKYDAVKILIDMLGLNLSVEEYASEVDAVLEELLPTAKVIQGAERLIRHLHKNKIPIAVCSGTTEHFYNLKTRNHKELFGLFDHKMLCGSDPEITRGKPHPQCFQICSKRFTLPPYSSENVLVFEDAPNGVEAALAANMQVVMIPDHRVDEEVREKATLCLESIEMFDPTLFGLPKFDD